MKKYKVTDEEGMTYSIEEEEVPTQDDDIAEETPAEEAPALTAEEITALKSLAAIASDLAKLVQAPEAEVTDEDEIEEDDEDVEVDIDVEEDEDEDDVVDTHDSAVSLQKKSTTKDSIDNEEAINDAWRKRFSNSLKGGNR